MKTKLLMCATLAAALAFGAGVANAGCVTKGAVATSSSAELRQVVCARNDGAVGELGSLARLRRERRRCGLPGRKQALPLQPGRRNGYVPRPRDLLHEVTEDQIHRIQRRPLKSDGRRYVVE